MASTHEPPQGRGLVRWETRAHAAVNTTARQFVYHWTARPSVTSRLLVVPLFVIAALLVIVVFAFLLALTITAALLAVVAARLGLLGERGGRSGSSLQR